MAVCCAVVSVLYVMPYTSSAENGTVSEPFTVKR